VDLISSLYPIFGNDKAFWMVFTNPTYPVIGQFLLCHLIAAQSLDLCCQANEPLNAEERISGLHAANLPYAPVY